MTPVPETSDSLLIRVRDSEDRASWDRFVAIYRPVVYRIGRRRGLQDTDAEDLAQRVMIQVANAIPDWEKDTRKGNFRGWLHRVSVNALISLLRSEKRHQASGGNDFLERTHALVASAEEIEQLIEEEHLRCRLRWAAEQVRGEFKDSSWRAFWLTTLEEVSVVDAADQLGISTGSVYAARSRVMRRLQEIARESIDEDRRPA